MKEYDIAAVFWDDHSQVYRNVLPKNPDSLIIPVLTVGIILDETDDVLVIASDIEKYLDRDDVSYTVIIKSTIKGIKIYGKIKIRKPRK